MKAEDFMSDAVREEAGVTKPFEFNGEGFEYFKIWIVNILLTILTLGIYSAWAKVRNKRYFYSNLCLEGHNFEYLADPITILKGRIIAVIVLVIYIGVSQFYPLAGAGLGIILMIALPWLTVRSLMFNNRMSAYRNVQFRFHGSAGEAAKVLFLWPLVGILTLGIMYPYALLKINKFIVENSAYGTTSFEFDATFKDYGLIFLFMIGIFLVGAGVFIGASMLLEPLGAFVMVLVYIVAIAYTAVAFANLYYNSTTLAAHGFEADLQVGAYAKVVLINLVLIVLTLGLYLPAAKVRLVKYYADNISFLPVGSLDDITAAERVNVAALSEELGEVFDFDIGVT
jgi:uncharacterized membrane protein YjgN (DUF898 family)